MGCVARYMVSGWVYSLAGKTLPYGTLAASSTKMETVRLLEEGSMVAAGANILLNVTVCIVAALVGIYLARQM